MGFLSEMLEWQNYDQSARCDRAEKSAKASVAEAEECVANLKRDQMKRLSSQFDRQMQASIRDDAIESAKALRKLGDEIAELARRHGFCLIEAAGLVETMYHSLSEEDKTTVINWIELLL